jgi:hypothetical protein
MVVVSMRPSNHRGGKVQERAVPSQSEDCIECIGKIDIKRA